MTLSILISLITAGIGLAVWGFRAYIARTSSSAVQDERNAGAAESQVEATNAEMDRITSAADAAGRVPVGQAADPNDRDGS